jgi:hypothetical protein
MNSSVIVYFKLRFICIVLDLFSQINYTLYFSLKKKTKLLLCRILQLFYKFCNAL